MTVAAPTTEETDPFCLPPLEAAALLYDAPWRRFAVIGDSLSAGTGDPSPGYTTLGWADRVADVLRRVRPDLAYLNTAEDGATTPETLRRQADRMLDFAPDLLHLPSGANDIVRRTPDFGEIEQNLRAMYRLAAGTGARLTVFTLGKAYVVPVFPDWRDRVRRVNDLTRALAAEFDATVIDMWDHPINERPNLLSADGIHFAAAGQAVMAAEVVKRLAHLLDSARTAHDGPRRMA
ncbi:lysophospholipase L1-like esterase [Nocardia tenerifensis]|uniref:Lysophospholipase L1-like esterase n=1 Tax=Nocardia tenerifensis TaxID=228006 RepID=A0A318KL88_9NOCA|nr:SGNH/GDSL hydrolase family protein [Nocardia tenerifensis]PXX69197.1 lysophospholipase L1-like esterase [Nocardia tenerifensis]